MFVVDGVDFEALTRWMDAQTLGSGEISNIESLAGGTQNILVKFTRSGRDFVLRRPPLHLRKNSNETMRREARVLGALTNTDVPHPRLIAGCAEEDILGAAFYLMDPIEGFNPGATIPLPEPYKSKGDWRHAMAMDLVDGISKLGSLDYGRLGLEGFGKPDQYLERQVGRWTSQLATYEAIEGWPGLGGIPGVDDVAKWLAERIPDRFVPGIIHGDYHLGNVMFEFDQPKLAAIVDWELATVGDPLVDLGWVMATWPIDGVLTPETVATQPWDGFPEIDDLVQRYGDHSDRDLGNVDWYAVLGCFKLGIILEGTYARACAGKAPKETGDDLHARTVALFARALNWINA